MQLKTERSFFISAAGETSRRRRRKCFNVYLVRNRLCSHGRRQQDSFLEEEREGSRKVSVEGLNGNQKLLNMTIFLYFSSLPSAFTIHWTSVVVFFSFNTAVWAGLLCYDLNRLLYLSVLHNKTLINKQPSEVKYVNWCVQRCRLKRT